MSRQTADWIRDARDDLENPDVSYRDNALFWLPRAIEALEAVLELHKPVAIYDECECEDTTTEGHVHDIYDIGSSCNKIYDACRTCCGASDDYSGWWMSEDCTEHDHGPDKPICKTRELIELKLIGART